MTALVDAGFVGIPQAQTSAMASSRTRLGERLKDYLSVVGEQGLTFDMSGGWKRAKHAGRRPLDGRVRAHVWFARD